MLTLVTWHEGHAVDTVSIVKHPIKYDPMPNVLDSRLY